jgi:oligoendopeptidase F
LLDAISFLPYGVLVDEFQHHIYEKPDFNTRRKKSFMEQA